MRDLVSHLTITNGDGGRAADFHGDTIGRTSQVSSPSTGSDGAATADSDVVILSCENVDQPDGADKKRELESF